MQRVRWCNLIAFTAMLCIGVGAFLGCSPQKRYEVLTFFFDGVPAPGGMEIRDEQGALITHLHEPYAAGKCGECHGSDNLEMSIARPVNIADIPSTVCLKCHQEIPDEYRLMHGPVAAAECSFCHSPHESSIPNLLKARAPAVCAQCHSAETMTADRPEHQDLKADCLTCHIGHGSHSRGLLRVNVVPKAQPAVSTLGPTTMPTAAAEGATTQPAISTLFPTTMPTASNAAATTQPAVSTAAPTTMPAVTSIAFDGGDGL